MVGEVVVDADTGRFTQELQASFHSPEFAQPGDIVTKLQEFANRTGQPIPQSVGELARCCLESLALCYADTVGQMESILNRKVGRLHLVGGGSQNQLLNELTCAAMDRPVVCGPVEATALGNVLTQAMGAGQLASLEEMRSLVRDSMQLDTLDPGQLAAELKPTAAIVERFQSL